MGNSYGWKPWIAVAAVAVMALIAVAVNGGSDSQGEADEERTGLSPGRITATALARESRQARATSTPIQKAPRVTYQIVTSRPSQSISLTYENASGNTEQRDLTTSSGWETSFDAEPGQFVYLSVQNGERLGSVECRILVNRTVIEQAKSEGAFVIATCSGSVPG